ncbi:MAG: PorT family protein [Bacteroidales bacterium]|nr:PorT family protein [Bacteroidales bacterium]
MRYSNSKWSLRLSAAIVALAVSYYATTSADAQTHYHSNVALGVRGGFDMSRVFFNPSVPQGFAPGGVAGVTFRYIEENHFGLIAELNFTRRGWKESFENAPQYQYTRHIDYLSLPVFAHIYFGRRGRFFFNAGPEFSLFLGESTSTNFSPAEIPDLPDFPIRYRTIAQMSTPVSQKFDYGISAGLGGEFNIDRRNSVAIEARVYYGLGNIFPSGRRDTFSGSNQMTISATAAYWFKIK